jgi:hypothetical protein
MFLDGFDLLERICFVYIVMVLSVVCLFGCIFTAFLAVTLYMPSCMDHLPKRHMMCAHFTTFCRFVVHHRYRVTLFALDSRLF